MNTRFRAALITGASSGIGRALALELAGRGTRLWLAARRARELDEVCALIRARGGAAQALVVDVRDAHAMAAAVQRAEAESGGLDLVVANAGIASGPGEPYDFAIVDEVLAVNLRGALACLCAALPIMRARRHGTLAAISSLAGYRGMPASGAYSASKAALSTFLESLRADLAGSGLTVCDVRPGFVNTAMTQGLSHSRPFEWSAARAARRIASDLERGRKRSSFPWPMAMALRALRSGPDFLWDLVAARVARARRAAEASASRSGRVSVVPVLGLVLVFGACALVATAIGLWEGEASPPRATQFARPSALRAELEARHAEQQLASDAASESAAPRAPRSSAELEAAREASSVRLRVRAFDSGGGPFLAPWSLELERLDLAGRAPEFVRRECADSAVEIDELDAGTWLLRAFGTASVAREVEFDMRAGETGREVQVTLRASARLEGLVLDEQRLGLEGLEVFAVAEGFRHPFRARTDAEGRYRFERLPSEWVRLALGGTRKPLVPALEFELLPGPQLAPEQRLAALCALRMLVLDERGRPVEGARLSAPNPVGGDFELVSDARGEAVARHLREGTWRVLAVHPELGRATAFAELPLSAELRLELRR